MRGSTAAALVNLALEESCGEALADQGAVAPLITLLGRSRDAAVLGNAAGALGILALSAGSARSMVAEGALAPLIGLLDRSRDVTVLGNAAAAVRNMARHGNLRRDVCDAGALPAIRAAAAGCGRVRATAVARCYRHGAWPEEPAAVRGPQPSGAGGIRVFPEWPRYSHGRCCRCRCLLHSRPARGS